jgi:hypothetical protein
LSCRKACFEEFTSLRMRSNTKSDFSYKKLKLTGKYQQGTKRFRDALKHHLRFNYRRAELGILVYEWQATIVVPPNKGGTDSGMDLQSLIYLSTLEISLHVQIGLHYPTKLETSRPPMPVICRQCKHDNLDIALCEACIV